MRWLVPGALAIIVGALEGCCCGCTDGSVDPDMTPLGIAAARITKLRNGQIYAAHCLLRLPEADQGR